jgi:hypothetical protein
MISSFFPAYSIVIALGLAKLKNETFKGIIAGFLMVLAVYALIPYYQRPAQKTSKEVIGYVAAHSQDGDVIIFTGWQRAPFQYYLEHLSPAPRLRLFSFPLAVEAHQGVYYAATYLQNPQQLSSDARHIREALSRDMSPSRKVWIFSDEFTAGATKEINRFMYAELSDLTVVDEFVYGVQAKFIRCLQQKEK